MGELLSRQLFGPVSVMHALIALAVFVVITSVWSRISRSQGLKRIEKHHKR